MNAEIVNHIAAEINSQIHSLIPFNVIWSWGISEQKATQFNGMASLALKVNGFQHKGWVIISLNEGKDLYNIYLLDKENNIVKTMEDVFCEDLPMLDNLIEKGSLTETEYSEKISCIFRSIPTHSICTECLYSIC
ncbi:hypothetical protein LJC68_07100 [Bacteroidales bacterium OttesenSCG-928-B11]|nr:hypothetical protein [Bacteroidales bacterium OttesenSCG-928-E04]MDL2309200.1 hypothetical protein [Bacteroidales bacterium OttesenSCG-928-C03]MDL2312626.1 hypothetical protein [Bacteroidales bacterium OttesenSCG-928-B11]